METIHIFGYFGALAIGLILGLMGSGGSLMAVPVLTYLFHISPVTTTAYSLFVVGTSASVGVLKNFNKGLIDLKVALIFAVPAFIAVYVARKFVLQVIPVELWSTERFTLTRDMGIMVFFAVLMAVASISMIRKKGVSTEPHGPARYNYPLIVFEGIVIGTLTGIVGIGGGFLIIPALVLCAKLPMKKAVATSLFIIALKSLIGFTGDLGHLEINWSFLIRFTLISILGIFMGMYLSSFVKGDRLKKTFGWFVLMVAFVIFYKELFV